jgi:hypothetical protein
MVKVNEHHGADDVRSELLLKDYDHRRQELSSLVDRYVRQGEVVTGYLTVLATLAVSLIAPPAGILGLIASRVNSSYFCGTVLSLGVAIAYFLISNLMEILNLIQIQAARSAAVEKKLNGLAGEELLVFDSEIIPFVYGAKKWRHGWSINPPILIGVWASAILTIAMTLLVLLSLARMPGLFTSLYAICVVLFLVFHAQQWWSLVTVRRAFVYDYIFTASGVSSPPTPTASQGARVNLTAKRLLPIIAAFITILLGGFPFLLFSLNTNSFWPHSSVNFPLTRVPSVLIGDTVLLPIFNAMAVDVLFNSRYRRVLDCVRKWVKAVVVVTVLAFSSIISGYLHYRWVHDQYTGFVNPQRGSISAGGLWHYFFSTGQMSIIILFLGVSALIAWQRIEGARSAVLRVWIVFLAYAALSLGDFAMKQRFVVHNPNLLYGLKSDWLLLTPLPLGIFALGILAWMFRSHPSRPS